MSPFIDALHVLALRSVTAPSARAALAGWHEDAPAELKMPLRQVSHRLALGSSVEDGLAPLSRVHARGAAALASVMADGSRQGSSLAVAVRRLATTLEQRAEMNDHARSAAVAARASTRLLGVLVAVFVIMLPQWRSAPRPLVGAVVLVAALLTWAGARWVRSLSPRPPSDDPPVAAIAEALASAMSAGLALDAALTAVHLDAGDLHTQLSAALRRRRMGAPWADAFTCVDDPSLTDLGKTIVAAMRSGAPLEERLLSLARVQRHQQRRDFELRAKKAPVMLVLPLTLCFLPAFALVVLVPLLGGLST